MTILHPDGCSVFLRQGRLQLTITLRRTNLRIIFDHDCNHDEEDILHATGKNELELEARVDVTTYGLRAQTALH